MKNIIVLAFALVFTSIGCKKEEKAATPSPTPTPSITYTSADSATSGNWILDVTETYVDGALVLSTLHSDPVYCHLDLQLAESTIAGAPGNWKACVYGLNCTNVAIQWRLNTGMIEIDSDLYTIVSQSTTNLVLQFGSMSVGNTAMKYYLHK